MAQQEAVGEGVSALNEIEQEESNTMKKVPSIPKTAFQKLCVDNGISEEAEMCIHVIHRL